MKINWTRVILGGLLAGLVVNVCEFVVNSLILGNEWAAAMKSLNRAAEMGIGAVAAFWMWGFLVGIYALWLYVTIRPRFGPGPKTLHKRRRKGSLHPQGDDLILAEMARQRVEGPGLHLAYEGTAAFLRDLCAALRVLERLDLLECQRVAFVEQATRNLQVQADQVGGIQAESGEALALPFINGNQVGQPMDALEDDPGGPGGQEGRSRLRGGYASPDQEVQGTRGGLPHFLDRRIESQGRLTAHESRGLAAFQDDAPDSQTILNHRGQEI